VQRPTSPNEPIRKDPATQGAVLRFTGPEVSDIKRFRGPGHLVSFADWMPGTARALVSLSHHSNEVRILQRAL